MRNKKNMNVNWLFAKKEERPVKINLPHTWNAVDGQDGGNDYYRGTCFYTKEFQRDELPEGEEIYLELEAAGMSARVYLNEQELGKHDGGFSTFRVNMTKFLQDENILQIAVSNEKNDYVYPQKADFTFYGGIYRDVNIIAVPKAHFDLDYFGGKGIKVTPVLADPDRCTYEVTVELWATEDAKTASVLVDGVSKDVAFENGYGAVTFTIENAHLWDGIHDPFLYKAMAVLDSGDAVEAAFGCRSFAIDPKEGFLLNGKSYPLCGAARHQDRWEVGNAITKEMQDEDMAIMVEMGANTIRLAHYQHSQYFYDLCDQTGMIVWAEIPYITEHLPNAKENSISQMKELVVQNYNHPSIICWGLSNEITTTGGVTEDIVDNHRVLQDICHELDQTRPTTAAHVFMLDPHEEFVKLPDIRSYNLYYGWYLGELEQNDDFFDKFHEENPDTVIGLSEFGADANPSYQSEKPEKGDWTEGYQALYHEHMLKMWSERKYIWAMHCWNMFDFGADGRSEGGKPGQNQKGLVTFDRKIKKDAFYIYKAYLSDEKFVHICGRRYVERECETTEIKVYSNLPEVSLYVNGTLVETKQGDKVFTFEIPNVGESMIKAVAGDCSDEIRIRKVSEKKKEYIKEGGEVVNWFDRPDEIVREGYYSIMDSSEELKKNPEAAALLEVLMAKAAEAYGDVAKNVSVPEELQRQMDRMPLEKTLKQAGKAITPEMVKKLNAQLNQIKKQ